MVYTFTVHITTRHKQEYLLKGPVSKDSLLKIFLCMREERPYSHCLWKCVLLVWNTKYYFCVVTAFFFLEEKG